MTTTNSLFSLGPSESGTPCRRRLCPPKHLMLIPLRRGVRPYVLSGSIVFNFSPLLTFYHMRTTCQNNHFVDLWAVQGRSRGIMLKSNLTYVCAQRGVENKAKNERGSNLNLKRTEKGKGRNSSCQTWKGPRRSLWQPRKLCKNQKNYRYKSFRFVWYTGNMAV